MSKPPLAPATLAAHAASIRRPDESAPAPHVEPIYQTSVFDFPSIAASLPALAGAQGHVYARNGLPNGDSLARAVAALEGAEAALATSSGMAAIACSVLALCGAGDRILVQRDAYGGTRALFDFDLARLGIEAHYVDAYDTAAVAERLQEGCRALLVETLSNPLVRAVDVAALAALCHPQDTVLVVDNTFATPLRDRPLEQGADLVVHSATKFLGGHHDLLAGVVAGPPPRVAAARGVAVRFGLGVAPLDAWLAVRGVRTLDVRLQRAWQSAAVLAARLGEHAAVRALHSAPRCALLAFDLGSRAAAEAAVEAFELITLAPSLGGTETTVSHPATSSHRVLPPEQRAAAGIGDGLLRLSVGLEDVEDLWRDLSAALSRGG